MMKQHLSYTNKFSKMRKCNRCFIEKPLSDYFTYKSSDGSRKPKTICKKCFMMARKGKTIKTNLTKQDMWNLLEKMKVKI